MEANYWPDDCALFKRIKPRAPLRERIFGLLNWTAGVLTGVVMGFAVILWWAGVEL